MHTNTIIYLLLALSAGALASPTTPNSPAPHLKRDFIIGNISTYTTTDCSGDPINPTFQDPTADRKPGKCLPFGADPEAHIGIHWGSVPGTTAVQFGYPSKNKGDECTGNLMVNVIYRDPSEQEFGCSTFKSAVGPAGFVVFVTWPLFS